MLEGLPLSEQLEVWLLKNSLLTVDQVCESNFLLSDHFEISCPQNPTFTNLQRDQTVLIKWKERTLTPELEETKEMDKSCLPHQTAGTPKKVCFKLDNESKK